MHTQSKYNKQGETVLVEEVENIEGSHWPTCLLQWDRRREGKTIEENDDVEEGLSNTEQQCGLYQELDLGTVEERQHSCLTKKDSTAKDKAGRGEYSRRNDTMCTMYIWWSVNKMDHIYTLCVVCVECTSTKLYIYIAYCINYVLALYTLRV